MLLAIISDIHANLDALRATLDDIAAHGADRILCLGDIVGYNTEADACIALLRQHDAFCIAGNHDRAVTGQITTEGFPHVAAKAVAWTREHLTAQARGYLAALPSKAVFEGKLVMVHGALHPQVGSEMVRLDNDAERRLSFAALAAHPSGARICAFGHTHQAGIFECHGDLVRQIDCDNAVLRDDACYLINPGTVGQPRSSDRRATYMLFDTARGYLLLRRVDYDFAAALAKTRRAGLAPPLSFLPASIREPLKRGVRAAGIYDMVRGVMR